MRRRKDAICRPGKWGKNRDTHLEFIHSLVSALEAGLAGTGVQSCDRYGSGTLHPRQVLEGSLPLLSPAFRRSHSRCQVPVRPQRDVRDPSSERWKCGREIVRQFCLNSDFHINLGIFYMTQIYDIGPTTLLPLQRKACWGFFRPKNPTASAGFEPANLGTKASTLPIDHRSRSQPIRYWQLNM